MSDMTDCLTAWRAAERQRDSIPRDTAAWIDADQAVRHACLEYQAIYARASVRYQEAVGPRLSAWWRMPQPQVHANVRR